MKKISKNEIVIMSLVGITILLFSLYQYYTSTCEKIVFQNPKDEDTTSFVEHKEEKEEKKEIMIDLCGQVRNEGVLVLEEDARMIDAIKASGGLLEDADRMKINLAKKLQDGEKIYIPKIGESVDKEFLQCEQTDKKININYAKESDLETLQGIGETLAKRIIEYREQNGEFKKVEDIMNVSGVGEKKYEMIKNNMKVN